MLLDSFCFLSLLLVHFVTNIRRGHFAVPWPPSQLVPALGMALKLFWLALEMMLIPTLCRVSSNSASLLAVPPTGLSPVPQIPWPPPTQHPLQPRLLPVVGVMKSSLWRPHCFCHYCGDTTNDKFHCKLDQSVQLSDSTKASLLMEDGYTEAELTQLL